MFNKVILTGNLSKDITLKSNSNITIANTTIAVNRKFKNQNGDTSEEVLFIDITFFGRQAQTANQYLNKGSKVLIEGRLKYDTWQDQNGQNRSKHSVVVENMEMLGGQQNQGGFNKDSEPNYNSGYPNNRSNSYQREDNSGYGREFNQNNRYQQNSNYNQKQQVEEPYQEKVPEIDLDADIKYDSKPSKSNFNDSSEDEIPF